MLRLDLELVPALRRAVTAGELLLHYQPEIDLADGSVLGMEALVRWQHPTRGVLWPAEFLPVAEAAGLMPEVGDWVLDACLREAAAWSALPVRPAGAPRQLWVNVSASQLAAAGFVDRLLERVAAAGVAPGTLGIEVTEEALVRGGAATATLLGELRAGGLALAVDDFGTWYSALGTLGELPVDAVKLDAGFVRGVGGDLDDDTIVASVIRLAHAHGLYVVAEGVESWAEGARLCELDCDRAQGFLFSGPQPPDRARWMIARGWGWREPGFVPRPRVTGVAGLAEPR